MSTSQARGPHHGEPENELPQPDPIRFYGTSWVDRSGGYRLRRALLGVGTALLTAAGLALLWFGYVGLRDSETAGWLRALVVVAVVLCSVMAFMRTWGGYTAPRASDAVDESAFRSIKVVGFLGVLLAYAARNAVEAPGEKLRRLDYETALERHRRLTTRRSGHPARRRKRGRS